MSVFPNREGRAHIAEEARTIMNHDKEKSVFIKLFFIS